jgi:peptide/nickel transport system permease protein
MLIRSRIRKNYRFIIGAGIVSFFALGCLIGPYLLQYGPLEQDLFNRLERPSLLHLLGTDEVGRDILSRLIYGARISLLIGIVGSGVAMIAGIILGTTAGFYSGGIDAIIMRFIDVLLAFPGILLAIMIVAILGSNAVSVMLAAGMFGIPPFARTVRACTLSIKEQVYIESARAIGVPNNWIIVKHVLPNALSPIIVLATLNIGTAILVGSGLSFLGLGVQPPAPEWGAMLSGGRTYIRVAPHLATIPGLALFAIVMAFNLLGDGLRDILDPSMRI